MAKYEITDNKTGKTVVVEGSRPPTTTDAEAIFQKAGLRQATQEPEKGLASKVTDFLIPRAKNYVMSEGKNVANRSGGENLLNALISGINPLAGLVTKVDNGKLNFDKEGLGTAGEVASFMIPANKLLKGGSAASKIAGGALQGAEIGAVSGITDPTADTLKQRIEKGVTSGLVGGVTGGAVQGLFEVGKAGVKSLVGNAADKINKIIRPNPSALDKFKKNTGLNYSEEIVKRDAQNIEGMNYSELQNYFKSKFQDASGKVDAALEKSGKTIKKDAIKNIFSETADLYKDRPSSSTRINQDFETYSKYLEQLPDDIPLNVANQLKRDIQELASSAYGNTSNSVPKAYQKVAARLNKEITNIFPEASKLNKETQLYRLVSDAVSRTGSREQNKISTTFVDKLLQSVPTTGGALATVATGNPLIGLGTLLAGAGASKGREIYRSPEVQTKLASMISKEVSPSLKALERALESTMRKGGAILSTK